MPTSSMGQILLPEKLIAKLPLTPTGAGSGSVSICVTSFQSAAQMLTTKMLFTRNASSLGL